MKSNTKGNLLVLMAMAGGLLLTSGPVLAHHGAATCTTVKSGHDEGRSRSSSGPIPQPDPLRRTRRKGTVVALDCRTEPPR